jgi:membrane-bound metal-dependent hydrolase YbcI (DUF457 family)
MFVGHYSVSFAARAASPRLPLWALFVAVQFLDVLWGVFVLVGLEKVRIVPGITATNPLDLYYMPYTHSLLAAVLWAVVAGLVWSRWKNDASGARWIGLAVFSHWVLDLIVHRPDLPLIGNRFKVGLGVWNMPALAFLLEAGLLAAGLLWSLTLRPPAARGGTTGFVVFGIAMMLVQAIVFFGSPPATPAAAAITALVAYAVLAAIAAWRDARRPLPSPPSTQGS